MISLLRRASLRYLLRHPLQTALSVVGIALGVGVFVATDLAGASAERAFELASAATAGRATHHLFGGPEGVEEELYVRLRREVPGVVAAPVVEGKVEAGGRGFHLLGVDPLAEAPIRPYLAGRGEHFDLAALMVTPDAVLLAADDARSLGAEVGDEVSLRVGTRPIAAPLVGLMVPRDAISRQALAGVMVTDIANAQVLLRRPEVVDRIDLVVPAGEEERLREWLPSSMEMVAAAARRSGRLEMTRAFRVNLVALSLLAMVCGAFLIYNTMLFSVVQRRRLLGVLRTLGVDRRRIFRLVLVEALVLGAAGTALGLGGGIVLARGLVTFVTRTVNDLYFAVEVRRVVLAPLTLAGGVGLGVVGTVLAAFSPAAEAALSSPGAALARSELERRSRRVTPWLAAAGVAIGLLAGGVLLVPSRSLVLSFAILFALLAGFALAVPAATGALFQVSLAPLGRLLGVVGRLAARGAAAALSRTGVAIAALTVAVAVTVGVGVMIGSFRGTVERWLGRALVADVYVSSGTGGRTAPRPLLPEVVTRLVSAPGVAAASRLRLTVLETPEGPLRLLATEPPPAARASYRFVEGEATTAWRDFQDGAALVSEPFAFRHRLGVGDTVRVPAEAGVRDLPVAGVYRDYGSDRGTVMVSRATYRALWSDPGATALALYAAPGVSTTELTAEVARLAGGAALVRSTGELRRASMAVFDRTFAVTRVLRMLAVLVAFIGVFSALAALQLERRRELGVLRANGLTPAQAWGLVTAQSGLLGLAAGLFALPLGTLLSAVLVTVINRRSFGWTLELSLPWTVYAQGLAISVGAALLAGLYPAWRLARSPVAEALREE